MICPLAMPRLRRSLRRNWWRSASPAGRPTETLLFLIPNSPTLLGQKPSYKRKLANRRSPITFSGYFLSKALPNKRSGRCLRHAAGERVQKKKNFPQVFSAPCKKADAKQSDGLACARGLSHWRLKKRKKKKKKPIPKSTVEYSVWGLPFGDCEKVSLGSRCLSTGLLASFVHSSLRFATLQ